MKANQYAHNELEIVPHVVFLLDVLGEIDPLALEIGAGKVANETCVVLVLHMRWTNTSTIV